jgi:hypothetical protein
MPTFIDAETIAQMFETSYSRSTFTGTEIAKIIRTRYGQESSKPKTHATNSKDSGQVSRGNTRN